MAVRYSASARGLLSKEQGDFFETQIQRACDYYKQSGTAYIQKTPEPMRIIGVQDRTKGVFTAVFKQKAQADFKGVMSGGRCIHFEAKSTGNDRIMQDAVTDTQTDDLNTTAAYGGECFVLVSLVKAGKFYRVPWDVWFGMKELFGHKYMNEENLAVYEIKMKTYGLDFLGAGYKQRDRE